MLRKYGLFAFLLVACVLLMGMPEPGVAATLRQTGDFFSDIGDALRDADNARDRFYQHRSGPDAARYEREWRDYESKLEDARIQRMSREAKIPPDELRKMRGDGHGWEDIAKRHKIDAHKMGYGHKGPHGYDRDRDHDMHRHMYKKDHPGKAKGHHKGTHDGPPGQHKKDKKYKKHGQNQQ